MTLNVFIHPSGVGVVFAWGLTDLGFVSDVASDLALPVYGDPEMRWEAYA